MAKKEKKTKEEQQAAEAFAAALPPEPPLPAARKVAEILEEEPAITPLWLITFTDVMALMLTFFVMLYSMSVPEEEKWVDVTAALNTEFNKFFSSKFEAGTEDAISISKLDLADALDLGYLKNLVTEMLKKEGLENVVLIQQRDNLILSMPQDLLFEPGQAEVKEEGIKALFAIGGALSRIKNRVEIMGHADPRPIQNAAARYSSNWELSLARAVSVAAVLENVGYRRPLAVRGFSSARFEDLPEKMTEEERMDLSRRVDIVIMKDDGSGSQMIDFGPI